MIFVHNYFIMIIFVILTARKTKRHTLSILIDIRTLISLLGGLVLPHSVLRAFLLEVLMLLVSDTLVLCDPLQD